MTQEEKINIAELLKDCPKGMELNCLMYEDVYFDYVDTLNIIHCYIQHKAHKTYLMFNQHGTPDDDIKSKCVIFPKGKTTWEGFQRPFMDGDIVCTILDGIAILGDRIEEYSEGFRSYCSLFNYGFDTNIIVSPQRLATEEEKAKLFQAIKNNGYNWNPETKTLEKLIEPKFKAGDKVKRKDADYTYIVTIAKLDDDYYDYVNEDGQCGVIHISTQNDWELVPNKFDSTTLKPFESKVLVRHNKDNKWCGSFFSHIDKDLHSNCYKFVTIAGKSYPMMIPYEGNEHLLGTTDDCDNFYKNW